MVGNYPAGPPRGGPSYREAKGGLLGGVALPIRWVDSQFLASLEQFLYKQRLDGKLPCKDVVVYDIEAWRSRTRDDYKDSSFKAEPVGFLEYYVLGKLATLARSWRVNRDNARLLKAHKTKPLTAPVATEPKSEPTPSGDSDNSESAAGSGSI